MAEELSDKFYRRDQQSLADVLDLVRAEKLNMEDRLAHIANIIDLAPGWLLAVENVRLIYRLAKNDPEAICPEKEPTGNPQKRPGRRRRRGRRSTE
jgi:hypothetical protein